MSEDNGGFPWSPYYGGFPFFESRMKSHSQVTSLQAMGGGVYELTLKHGNTLRVFACECYSFGAAEYVETINELGKLDVILINSAWCNYTLDAKHLCRSNKVGLFKIKDFMAALNRHDIANYLNSDEEEKFTKNGWL